VADRPLVEVLETPALDGPVLLLALDGWIDEVRVYNRALSADEVGTLYAY